MFDFLLPSEPVTKTQRTRQRILRAAIDVFAHKGYHETRVDEIVTKSHTSKGAVYSHFVSKERIFLAIVDEFASALLSHLDDAISEAEDGIDRVDAALSVCLDTFSKHRRLARIFLVQAVGLGRVFENKRLQIHARFVRLIRTYLDQAVDDGDIPPQDTAVAAYAWMGAINETVINWLHTGQPELESSLPDLRRMLLRSIGVAEPRLRQRETPSISLDPGLHLSEGFVLSYTLPWTDMSLLRFLQHAPSSPRVYWSNAEAPIALAGHGATSVLSSSKPSRFRDIRDQANHLFERTILCGDGHPPQVGPRLIGGFSFRSGTQDNIWQAFPPAWFVLPTYQLTRYKGQAWLTVNHRISSRISPKDMTTIIQQKCDQLVQHSHEDFVSVSRPSHRTSGTSQLEWERQVFNALDQIQHGILEKVVLARYAQLQAPISSLRMLRKLKQSYASCYRFLFEPQSGHSFYGASPELLVESQGRSIRSVALAGSIRRGLSNDEDTVLENQLLKSDKDNSEHQLVVQAIRKNLAPLVKEIQVPDTPQLLQLRNIQHLKTVLKATTRSEADILAIVEALHPTPAVCGVPSEEAHKLIAQNEPVTRGWYAGPVGWLDPQGNGQFAVALRAAITSGQQTRLYAGAGIMANSDPTQEWEETEWKLRPLLDALASLNS